MKIFLQNGTITDNFSNELSKYFYIIKNDLAIQQKYIYNGDSILYDLDSELVLLYDKFRDLLFDDIDKYYNKLKLMPIFVKEAGQDSDSSLTSDQFTKLINEFYPKIGSDLIKYLYLADCQYLINTIQNLIAGVNDCFINFFVNLCQYEIINDLSKDEDAVIWQSSNNSTILSSLLETYFIKSYSILDILTKIVYELHNPLKEFEKYKKLNCSEILWGNRKKLEIINTVNTLWEDCLLVKTIESLRNESVHNGAWEYCPKVFFAFQKGNLIEKYMLFPDLNNGRLSNVKNRRHFFGKNLKVNNILPNIHIELLTRLLNTVKNINQGVI